MTPQVAPQGVGSMALALCLDSSHTESFRWRHKGWTGHVPTKRSCGPPCHAAGDAVRPSSPAPPILSSSSSTLPEPQHLSALLACTHCARPWMWNKTPRHAERLVAVSGRAAGWRRGGGGGAWPPRVPETTSSASPVLGIAGISAALAFLRTKIRLASSLGVTIDCCNTASSDTLCYVTFPSAFATLSILEPMKIREASLVPRLTTCCCAETVLLLCRRVMAGLRS